MCTENVGDIDTALALLDVSHAQLLRDPKTLDVVDAALRDLASSEPQASLQRGVILYGQLSRQLNIRSATLRKWEKTGLVEL